jgi:hypothetical protein
MHSAHPMPSRRLYTNDTPVMREALTLVPRLAGLPDDTSAPQRMQAMAELVVRRAHEEEAEQARLEAYEAMAADTERRERIRRSVRARVKAGLL